MNVEGHLLRKINLVLLKYFRIWIHFNVSIDAYNALVFLILCLNVISLFYTKSSNTSNISHGIILSNTFLNFVSNCWYFFLFNYEQNTKAKAYKKKKRKMMLKHHVKYHPVINENISAFKERVYHFIKVSSYYEWCHIPEFHTKYLSYCTFTCLYKTNVEHFTSTIF